MSIIQLVIKEILFRKSGILLALLSVVVAVSCLVGAFTLLKVHDLSTDRIISEKEAQTRKEMKKMEDDYRKIMKNLGFNLLILPKDQKIDDLYSNDYSTKYMPEKYVETLKKSKLMTLIRHLVPILQQKIKWPEKERTIILIGVRGEKADTGLKEENMFDPILPGTVVVGYELHKSLGIKINEKITLLGKSFTAVKLQEERGNKDDISLWVNLKEAQEMFDKKGIINGIMALECYCPLPIIQNIRSDIAKILPDTRIVEFSSDVVTRAEARARAEQAAKDSVIAEKNNRSKLRAEMENFTSILVPLVILACAIWVGFMFFGNVRERKFEIGILRAMGCSSFDIMKLFLFKAGIIGLIAGPAGYLFGLLIGSSIENSTAGVFSYFDPNLFIWVLMLTPLVSCLASWIPAVTAAGQDPANILGKE
ncbi:MAG: hypothetical protein A2452_01875 [Candidatus Firestonebacteria bacterium RIFOXYC2_FULL_39_67]|nr:MAG: hypothetical protein A2536_12685 [Candidatus Firestonebacteria bacterium RIFOXYD2_FULL_39_29]OGF57063.1 MAG: hypothetical protein A2452_01875 [Candidatus Firestonebacteria bacterium RIFOXYC2_FULL_39_67]OGF57236.1 MAG: hypothetical protein A2497_06415 [Candidatus Firestonebacteria bacterium RifOxyC12_full_39_7]